MQCTALWDESPQAATLLGYPAEAVTFELLPAAIHPDDQPLVRHAAQLAEEFMAHVGAGPVAAGQPGSCVSLDYRLRCRAGHYRRVLCQRFGLGPPVAGQALAVGHLFTDITGHKTSGDVRFSIDHPDFMAWTHTRQGARSGDRLSRREQEIMVRMLAGGTNAMLSQELFISELTLKTHRRNIHRKLKATKGASPLARATPGGRPAA